MSTTKSDASSPDQSQERKELIEKWKNIVPRTERGRKLRDLKVEQLESGVPLMSDEEFDAYLEEIAG